MCRQSSALRRGGRPVRDARCSARRLPAANCCAQRVTDWRCTPTRRATSAWATPWPSHRAARIRRRSSLTRSNGTPAGCPIPRAYLTGSGRVTLLCNISDSSGLTVHGVTPSCGSFALEQGRDPSARGAGDLREREKRDVELAAFEAGDVGPIQPSGMGEGFLGQPFARRAVRRRFPTLVRRGLDVLVGTPRLWRADRYVVARRP